MIDLTELDQVRCLLDDLHSGADTELKMRITAVSHRAQTFMNRDFEKQTYTETLHGGTHRLYPLNPPVVSITSIKWDDFFDFTNAFTIPTNEYKLVNHNFDVAYINGPFPGSQDSIQLIYIGGYDPLGVVATPSNIPKEIQFAVASQVAYEFRHRKDFGLRDVEFPDGRIEKQADQDFILPVRQVLLRHRVTNIL